MTGKPTCTHSEDVLRAFDGESSAGNLATHMVECAVCNDTLDTLKTQRDALKFLATTPEVAEPVGLVARVLAVSAQAGRATLADLLYELAKACLVQAPEFALRVERLVEPRETEVVSGELRAIGERVGSAMPQADIGSLPKHVPQANRALEAAQTCLGVLMNVEGDSSRHQLALSQLMMFTDRPGDAETLLQGLLNRDLADDHRCLAYRNLMWARIRQNDFQGAADVGRSATAQYPKDAILWTNYAVAASHLGDRDLFGALSERISSLVREGVSAHALGILERELAGFAEDQGVSSDHIARVFGLAHARRDQR